MALPKGLRGHLPTPLEKPEPVHIYTEELGEKVPLMSNSPDQWLAKTGMMLRVLVGSTVHGTAIVGQDDRDEMGICVESPQYVIGLQKFKHYSFRTAEQRQPIKNGKAPCSGPNDLDLIVYSLRRYVSLAAAGNPTMLLPLFVPEDAVLYANTFGRELRKHRDMLLSRRMAAKFKGYLHSQRRGLLGLRSGGSRNQGRADIREKYGFDSKFAMHMVRLGYQGEELLRTGKITLPMKRSQLTALQELRRGERTKEWALNEALKYEELLDELEGKSGLPDWPDWQKINSWLADVHRRHWKWTA